MSKELLLQRLKQEKKNGTLTTIYTLDGKTYTPDDIIREAEQDTPIGNEFLLAEKKLMDYLKQKMGEP